MSFQSVSVCPGMPWNPGSGWAAPIQGGSTGGEQDAALNAAAQGASVLGRTAQRAQRRRARTDQGTFQGDNPATADIDEAYEPDREN